MHRPLSANPFVWCQGSHHSLQNAGYDISTTFTNARPCSMQMWGHDPLLTFFLFHFLLFSYAHLWLQQWTVVQKNVQNNLKSLCIGMFGPKFVGQSSAEQHKQSEIRSCVRRAKLFSFRDFTQDLFFVVHNLTSIIAPKPN